MPPMIMPMMMLMSMTMTTDDEGSMTGKREAPISYRPPRHLRAEFDRRVRQSGVSTCAFITKAVFGIEPPRQSRRPSVELEAIGRLTAEMARVRDRLEEIIRMQGASSPDTRLIEEAVRHLSDMRAALFRATGRKP